MTVETRYRDPSRHTTTDGQELPNIPGILNGLPTLLKNDIVPVFVFDGELEERKADEIEKRRQAKEDAKKQLEKAKERGDIKAARKYKSQAQWLTQDIRESSIRLLQELGIPTVHSDGAGEGYAASLTTDGETPVKAVYTGDYDAILFGSSDTIRPTRGDDGPEAERISLENTLSNLELTHQQLVDAAILIGTDYNDGVKGIGPKRAVKYLKRGDDIMDIINRRESQFTHDDVSELRDIFLTPPTGETPDQWEISCPENTLIRDIVSDFGLDQQQLGERIDTVCDYLNSARESRR